MTGGAPSGTSPPYCVLKPTLALKDYNLYPSCFCIYLKRYVKFEYINLLFNRKRSVNRWSNVATHLAMTPQKVTSDREAAIFYFNRYYLLASLRTK